ncbi:MAG: hypothetical protein ACI35W_07875 [Anaeroplasmataceae bacterium]
MKVNIRLNNNNEVIGYSLYPIDLNKVVIDIPKIPIDFLGGNYIYKDNKIVKKDDSILLKYNKEKLKKAFTEYRNDVNYGVIKEDEITHNQLLNWYKNINNNDVNSINNPPKIILKYLEDNKWI